MAKNKSKYYVVWVGKQPGIYTTWAACKAQIEHVPGARYKSFPDRLTAEEAYRLGPQAAAMRSSTTSSTILEVDSSGRTIIKSDADPTVPRPDLNSLAVDAACSGNPGVMEYRGVYVATRTQVFHFKVPLGTNNIGEFLAIVHGLAYLKKHGLNLIIYSDSVNAIRWVRDKHCRTKLIHNEQTAPLYEVIRRAEYWLVTNTYTTEIRKWDTSLWGEIPADFNRK